MFQTTELMQEKLELSIAGLAGTGITPETSPAKCVVIKLPISLCRPSLPNKERMSGHHSSAVKAMGSRQTQKWDEEVRTSL